MTYLLQFVPANAQQLQVLSQYTTHIQIVSADEQGTAHHLSNSCNPIQDYGFQSGLAAIGDSGTFVEAGLTAFAIEMT